MHINAHRAGFVLGVLIVVQYGELRGTAQGLPSVRVIPAEAKVFARPDVISDVVTVTRAGAILDLIDRREGWYWILSGRDQNGSRQSGWIQADQVAIATAPTSRDSLRTLHEELGALPKPAGPRPPQIDSGRPSKSRLGKRRGKPEPPRVSKRPPGSTPRRPSKSKLGKRRGKPEPPRVSKRPPGSTPRRPSESRLGKRRRKPEPPRVSKRPPATLKRPAVSTRASRKSPSRLADPAHLPSAVKKGTSTRRHFVVE